jgi:type IV pilus assembly protein PilX
MNRERTQRGAALIIALVLLAVMTILGLSVLRSTLMDERMSGSLYDRSLAFQAAEGALREAEARLEPGTLVFPPSGCTGELCAQIDRVANPGAPDRWLDPAFAGWTPTAVFNPGAIVGDTPDYFIESMGPAPNWAGCEQEIPMHPNCMTPRFRVTARSAAADRAQVVLQSNYAAVAP